MSGLTDLGFWGEEVVKELGIWAFSFGGRCQVVSELAVMAGVSDGGGCYRCGRSCSGVGGLVRICSSYA
ncbi:hypothetical protein M6B38_268000 [Iris pallida]|uniref:Uncharacterized protein n=1 Tax=Iris pallida TaxID=29817 RepID=A0AAX6FX91_IRIPA|nr:hypothetical protein M6B38_396390 [Iris pallida]KAJ6835708.1 hypothetical protein M6B38_330710 [Iris pallida]KAJ6849640.1 hypothetical protein M6B38_268000 [Iris pallida]